MQRPLSQYQVSFAVWPTQNEGPILPDRVLHVETPAGRFEDSDGTWFGSVARARAEAVAFIAETASSHLKSGRPIQGMRIDVSNEVGRALDNVTVEDIIR